METNLLTEEQLQEAFCEVRKAHRLIYEYQRRMRDLSWFIKNKLDFKKYEGYKRFSNALNDREGNNAEKSSWDWMFTAVFEYFLGYQKFDRDTKKIGLSVIQVSDTGCYNENKRNYKISSFPSAEKTESRLLFYLVVGPDALDLDWRAEDIIAKYILEDKPNIFIPEKRQDLIKVTYSVPLSKFLNEEATMQILREFVQFCNENAGTNLKIQESEQ